MTLLRHLGVLVHIGGALVVGGLAAYALAAFVGLDAGKVVVGLLPALIGLVAWQGTRPVAEAISWTVPLAAWCLASFLLVPEVVGSIMFILGLFFLGAMILTESVPAWWVNQLLRRPRDS